MTGDTSETEARVVDPPIVGEEGVRLDVLVGQQAVTVWFDDRSSDGAARGASPSAMRVAIKVAREYRRAHRETFERLFEELER